MFVGSCQPLRGGGIPDRTAWDGTDRTWTKEEATNGPGPLKSNFKRLRHTMKTGRK